MENESEKVRAISIKYVHIHNRMDEKSGLQFSVGFKLSAVAATITIATGGGAAASADNHVTQLFHFIFNSTSTTELDAIILK